MPSKGICDGCGKDLHCWHSDYGEVDGHVSIYCDECVDKLGSDRLDF